MIKRLFDITVSLTLLILLFPVLVLVGLLVALDSPGPILYRGRRVGKDGKVFSVLKFRTMVTGADRMGPAITGGSDARVTRVGKFLRKWKLDEVPQFYNVLRGEMSLVGPRPEAPRYVKLYTDEERLVLSVKPGVTGISQVFFRNEESLLRRDDAEQFYVDCVMREKLKFDLAYVKHHSFLIDLGLIGITVVAIASPRVGLLLAEHFARAIWSLSMPQCSTLTVAISTTSTTCPGGERKQARATRR